MRRCGVKCLRLLALLCVFGLGQGVVSLCLAQTDAPQTGFATVDLARETAPQGFDLNNLSKLETNNRRWALGPETSVVLTDADLPQNLTLRLRFLNPVRGQGVEVLFNGEVVESLLGLVKGVTFERTYSLKTRPGSNTLTFRYAHWNHQGVANPIERARVHFAPTDPRAMAILLNRLEFSADAPQPLSPYDADLIARERPASLDLSGLAALETDEQRWAIGDHATVSFWLEQPGPLFLTTRFVTTLERQGVEISFNDQRVTAYPRLTVETVAEFRVELDARAGQNTLRFDFADWRGHGNPLIEDDPRPLAVVFDKLELRRAY